MVRIRRRAPGGASRIERSDSAHAALKGLLAEIKGDKGEALVKQRLTELGVPALHDIRLPKADGSGTTQIDHLVCLPDAIMVIETKHFSGRISGHPADRHWRQRLGNEVDGRLIYSPLQQNAVHCAAVRALCIMLRPDLAILNRVVLTGNAVLNPELADCTHALDALAVEILHRQGASAQGEQTSVWNRLIVSSTGTPRPGQ